MLPVGRCALRKKFLIAREKDQKSALQIIKKKKVGEDVGAGGGVGRLWSVEVRKTA